MSVWGIVPAAGSGTRIQPLAFSKELLPVGSRVDEAGYERPRAVGEYLIERMARSGVDKLCIVISSQKHDIVQYFGGTVAGMPVAYVVQDHAAGLCDAIFRALPLVADEDHVVVGLPDTIWFPKDALASLPTGVLAFLLFPVSRPEFFDAVATDAAGRVRAIEVKSPTPSTNWIWGAFKLPGSVFRALHALWQERGEADAYIGTLVNAWLERGGEARAIRAGTRYVDVGTLHGYREAIALLTKPAETCE